MNATEKKYVLRRLKEEFNKLNSEITKEYSIESKRLSNKQRIEAFNKGDYKIKKSATSTHYVADLIEFNGERKAEIFHDKIRPIKRKLLVEYNRACDGVMLGDSKEALTIIQQFSSIDWKKL